MPFFNTWSPKHLIYLYFQCPKIFLKLCQKDDKLLAYSRKRQQKFILSKENYLRTRPFQCQHRFWTFRSKMEFCSFLEKKSRNATDTQKKALVGQLVLTHKKKEKKYLLKFGTYPKYHGIVQWNLLPPSPRLAMGMWNGEKEVNFFAMCQFIIRQRLKQSVIFFYCLFLIIMSCSFSDHISLTNKNQAFVLDCE